MGTKRPHRMTGTTRRQFLAGAAALAAPCLVPASALGGRGRVAPGDRIGVGIIGVGGRGGVHVKTLLGMEQAQILAVCDPQRLRRDGRKQQIDKHYAAAAGRAYKGCGSHNDFRELLARDDIDAVFGAAVGQWHGLHYVTAARAGKDIYGEKPLTLTAAEGRAVCDAVRRYGTVFQTGLQQRSDPRFRFACELARSGYLGDVRSVKVGVPGGATVPTAPTVPVPDHFDYNLWLGPAPATPFNEVKCRSEAFWGHIHDYSLGFMSAWGVHHLDIAQWGAPSLTTGKVQIQGTATFPESGMADTPLTWRVELVAADGVRLSFTDLSENAMGCRLEGSKGWVHVNRKEIRAEPASLLTVAIKPSDTRLYASTHHQGNFLDCVRTRGATAMPVDEGHRATLLPILSDIAIRTRRRLTWDWAAERFVGDAEAHRRLRRAMRAPWSL